MFLVHSLHKFRYHLYRGVPVLLAAMGAISNIYENSQIDSNVKVNNGVNDPGDRSDQFWGRKFFHILFKSYWVAIYTYSMNFNNKHMTVNISANFHNNLKRPQWYTQGQGRNWFMKNIVSRKSYVRLPLNIRKWLRGGCWWRIQERHWN